MPCLEKSWEASQVACLVLGTGLAHSCLRRCCRAAQIIVQTVSHPFVITRKPALRRGPFVGIV